MSDPAETQVQGTHLRAELRVEVSAVATLVLSLSPTPDSGRLLVEELRVQRGGDLVGYRELDGTQPERLQVVESDLGVLDIEYEATIDLDRSAVRTGSAFDALVFTRPSRYCPSDHLAGFANAEFADGGSALERAESIARWIAGRVRYLGGVGTVHDTAEDTLLTGVGSCRDFAHLGIALCRAVDIPARFAAVWAPGLDPMDFHAVFEVLDSGRWWCLDATGKAPRASMVRIATGRDAADAPFLTVTSGCAELVGMQVSAVAPGRLPDEAPGDRVSLA